MNEVCRTTQSTKTKYQQPSENLWENENTKDLEKDNFHFKVLKSELVWSLTGRQMISATTSKLSQSDSFK